MPSTPETQTIHKELLVLLKEFHRICMDNGIKYSLHGGTLLGAIREKGFIPWDDDTDVTMTRAEFERLLMCFNQQSQEYELIETYLHMPRIICRQRKTDVPFVWLDILIYDSISENKVLHKIKVLGTGLFKAICRDESTIRLVGNKGYGALQMEVLRLAYFLGKPFSYAAKYKWYTTFCKKMLCGSGKMIYRSNDQMRWVKLMLPAYYMETYDFVPFEDAQLMVSAKYHEILTSSYGPDYMTPVQDKRNEIIHSGFKMAFLQHLDRKEV